MYNEIEMNFNAGKEKNFYFSFNLWVSSLVGRKMISK